MSHIVAADANSSIATHVMSCMVGTYEEICCLTFATYELNLKLIFCATHSLTLLYTIEFSFLIDVDVAIVALLRHFCCHKR